MLAMILPRDIRVGPSAARITDISLYQHSAYLSLFDALYPSPSSRRIERW